MKSIAIVNSGLSNLDSIFRALEECGGTPFVTADPEHVRNADRILLPGVGAFRAAMQALTPTGLDEAIKGAATKGTPVLGICLGMQLLADESDEMGLHKGLGLIPGRVERLISSEPKERIPHMGWNSVTARAPNPLLENINPNTDFYFVHSYHFECSGNHAVATTPYCGEFVSVVQRENIFGTQFHPEKSLHSGLALLTNFLSL